MRAWSDVKRPCRCRPDGSRRLGPNFSPGLGLSETSYASNVVACRYIDMGAQYYVRCVVCVFKWYSYCVQHRLQERSCCDDAAICWIELSCWHNSPRCEEETIDMTPNFIPRSSCQVKSKPVFYRHFRMFSLILLEPFQNPQRERLSLPASQILTTEPLCFKQSRWPLVNLVW